MGIFDGATDGIYRDKDVLDEDYQPDQVLEREDEIADYRDALLDVLFGRTPDNIFLYGKAGVGKTAVTNFVLGELQAEVETRDTADPIHISRVNCDSETTYSVIRELANGLLPATHSPYAAKGYSTSDLFDELYEQMERVGGTHLIVLDEVDHLSDPDALLYQLPRARANGYLNDARVGIIGISNNYTFRNTLSSKVKSTLMETEISFSTYDADELVSILEHRADLAFQPGVCEDSAITLCAAYAAKDDGSARQAIDLLRAAADAAWKADDPTITDAHVKDVRDDVDRGQLHDKISDQTTNAQRVLEAAARLQNEHGEPARTREIQESYQQLARSYGDPDPSTSLKFAQRHLDDLEMLGFVIKSEENRGKGGGRSYIWEVDMDLETVIDVREDIEQTNAA
ncbi:orc1/cdc6 family replication initiation protein [Halarchaeum rubridurum]|uniref:ORC1-type DNA replication protein n=1 Tax=Halarchaeum rubridurum TaxID=489911 RepID=A0A830G5J5_9EURY|nr:orc1/cdc6 family replication initiation protein [Halarchaeum rubridurum]MBP1955844.1 orc1/cdc6 family replication initiation protein [Halarchaeum rubridurum]GGM75746.1 cell division control protein Cdc6 [Halarchaeum rubridurum]